jgi:hypothetical protein
MHDMLWRVHLRYTAGETLRPFGFGVSLAQWRWEWNATSQARGAQAAPAPIRKTAAEVAALAQRRVGALLLQVKATRLAAPADERLAAAGTDTVGVAALGFLRSNTNDEQRRLFGFARVGALAVGQSGGVQLEIPAQSLTEVDEAGARWALPGSYEIDVEGLQAQLVVTGDKELVEPSPFASA